MAIMAIQRWLYGYGYMVMAMAMVMASEGNVELEPLNPSVRCAEFCEVLMSSAKRPRQEEANDDRKVMQCLPC